jgi:hypothetical protein
MKIEITKIEKASLVFEKIKNLHAEICKVESLALFASCNDFKGKFKLTLTDSDSKAKPENDFTHFLDIQTEFMHDVFKKRNPNYSSGLFQTLSAEKTNKNDSNTLLDQLSETATMQILGIILCEKQNQLKVVLEELEEIGVFHSK